MKMIKISVITVVRNGMPFVEQTIKSVIGQNYQNLEYIVIDGGSTDGTLEIIKANEHGITRWISEKDNGISDAFNKGFALASGDYILFLNSDDALSSQNAVKDMADKIVENEFPALIYGDCAVLDRNTDEVLYVTDIEFSPSRLYSGRQMLPHPCLFAHRSYFEQYGTFDTQFKIAMDYEWLLRGGLKERVVHIPVLVTNVRNGGVSALNTRCAAKEIISALKKNHFIPHGWAEQKLRGYFFARHIVKSILKGVGVYKVFANFRSKNK